MALSDNQKKDWYLINANHRANIKVEFILPTGVGDSNRGGSVCWAGANENLFHLNVLQWGAARPSTHSWNRPTQWWLGEVSETGCYKAQKPPTLLTPPPGPTNQTWGRKMKIAGTVFFSLKASQNWFFCNFLWPTIIKKVILDKFCQSCQFGGVWGFKPTIARIINWGGDMQQDPLKTQ